MKEHYYQGEDYLNADTDLPKDRISKVCAVCEKPQTTDFFKTLIDDIQSVIGEGNFEYDFFEMGSAGFMLFWWIDADKYTFIMNDMKNWHKAQGLEDVMAFQIKDASDPNNRELYKIAGNEAVIDNYYHN